MIRHSNTRGAAGFSMVELLVTVVLAGIVFSAMIPMVLTAQKASSKDKMRNVALQLARDKIERIRQLDYDRVTKTWLEDNGPPTNSAGQFGKQWTASGAGAKTYTIAYAVNNKPDGKPDGQESHKSVQVTVTWPAVSPQVTVKLQTDVSRQYFGPETTTLFSPDADYSGTPTIEAGGNVRLIAVVKTDDLAQMQAVTPPDYLDKGNVVFSVTDVNGSQVASGESDTQLNPSIPTGINGQYQWTWDASTANTGYYTVLAYAVSNSGAAGKPWSATFYVHSDNPPAPTLTTADAGDQCVTLSWTPVSGSDHYQVWRSTTSHAEVKVVDSCTATSLVDGPPTYAALSNGTTYYYYVIAVDTAGRRSAASNEKSVMPVNGPDNTPPTAPSNLTSPAQTTTTISLAWTASQDNPPPTVPNGVSLYEIYRSSDGATWPATATATVIGAPPIPPASSYTDTGPPVTGLTPNTRYYYKVRAFDGANWSAFCAAASFVTASTPTTHNLTVTNTSNGNKTASVTVQCITSGPYYQSYFDLSGNDYATAPSITISNKSPNFKTWTNLPAGLYIVVAKYGSSTTQVSPNPDLTLQDRSVSFSF
jgi:type II secretory pathway pseudopilin PulG/fibronectin type 3 domain-containing protein